MAEMSSEEHVDRNILDAVLSQLRASAKAGDVVWLTEDGLKVGAVVPVDVAEAGMAALGRET